MNFIKVDTPNILAGLGVKKVVEMPIASIDEIRICHKNRIDNNTRFFDTKQTCKVSIYENFAKEKFFKFGCIFIIDSKKLVELDKKSLELFVYDLQKRFLECHFNSQTASYICDRYITIFNNILRR